MAHTRRSGRRTPLPGRLPALLLCHKKLPIHLSGKRAMALRHSRVRYAFSWLTCFFPRWYEELPVNVLFACEWAEPLGERLLLKAPRWLDTVWWSRPPPSGRVRSMTSAAASSAAASPAPPPRSETGGLDGWTLVGIFPAADPRSPCPGLTGRRRARTPPPPPPPLPRACPAGPPDRRRRRRGVRVIRGRCDRDHGPGRPHAGHLDCRGLHRRRHSILHLVRRHRHGRLRVPRPDRDDQRPGRRYISEVASAGAGGTACPGVRLRRARRRVPALGARCRVLPRPALGAFQAARRAGDDLPRDALSARRHDAARPRLLPPGGGGVRRAGLWPGPARGAGVRRGGGGRRG